MKTSQNLQQKEQIRDDAKQKLEAEFGTNTQKGMFGQIASVREFGDAGKKLGREPLTEAPDAFALRISREPSQVRAKKNPDPFLKLFTQASSTPAGLTDGYRKICQRWNLNELQTAKLLNLENDLGLCQLILSGQVPPITGDLKDRMTYIIGISVGLGFLFNDDKEAELHWLNMDKEQFDGLSALNHMLDGSFANLLSVVQTVESARGLE
ncbi:MAG: hypothetical protein GY789_06170 [Hyphomicrobiales bacterium]|nr:hypothetical protein [Hyphomicrobiales bacterium]